MKTAIRWFEDLPSPYSKRAIEASIRERKAHSLHEDLQGALLSGFVWRRARIIHCLSAEENHNFFVNLREYLYNNKKVGTKELRKYFADRNLLNENA